MNYSTLTNFSARANLTHAILNRHGGASKPPFDSLNLSFGVNDDPASVWANREKIRKGLGLTHLISARQIHADRVLIIKTKPKTALEEEGYDALISNLPGLGLLVQQADCQAVMLFDPGRKVVANIHSGWKGSTLNIIGKTVEAMRHNFGTAPAEILAGISPSLGPCCAEFIHFQSELPLALHKYQKRANYFDFWAVSRDQLLSAGLARNNIEIAGICTRCNHDYFSYRRNKTTGRCGSIIALNPPTN